MYYLWFGKIVTHKGWLTLVPTVIGWCSALAYERLHQGIDIPETVACWVRPVIFRHPASGWRGEGLLYWKCWRPTKKGGGGGGSGTVAPHGTGPPRAGHASLSSVVQ